MEAAGVAESEMGIAVPVDAVALVGVVAESEAVAELAHVAAVSEDTVAAELADVAAVLGDVVEAGLADVAPVHLVPWLPVAACLAV